MTETRELALIAEGARMLAEARGLFEVRDVRSVAVAAVAYARAKDLGEDAIRSANRIVILATARIGEEIVAGQERGEIATADGGRPVSVTAADTSPATLPELGISRNLSSTAQRLARAGERVREYLDASPDPTLAGAVRAAGPAVPAPDPMAMNDVHRAKWPHLAAAELRSDLTTAMYAFGKPEKFESEDWVDRIGRLRPEDLALVNQHLAYIRRWLDKWDRLLERPALALIERSPE